jgi:50S ribosomal protein L16 3-hydroxylase
MGEYLTEPKANVWFAGDDTEAVGDVRLDRRTRMLYDGKHIFINGESFRAGGRDAQLMRRLANERSLKAGDMVRLSDAARELVSDWCQAGWLHADQ